MSLSAVIAAISTDLVARLAAGGITLSGATGGVLVGPEYVNENDAPPKIVAVPKGSAFGPRDMPNGWSTKTPFVRGQSQVQRSIATAMTTTEVHVWGNDYDQTELLRDQFILAMHYTMPGCYSLGSWRRNDSALIVHCGRELIFDFTVFLPILDAACPRAPMGTTGAPTGSLILPGGETLSGVCGS